MGHGGLRRTYLVGQLLVLARPNCSWLGAAVILEGLGCREVATEYGLRLLPRVVKGQPRDTGAGAGEDIGGPRPGSAGLSGSQARPLFSRIPGYLMPNLLEEASINPCQGTDTFSNRSACLC